MSVRIFGSVSQAQHGCKLLKCLKLLGKCSLSSREGAAPQTPPVHDPAGCSTVGFRAGLTCDAPSNLPFNSIKAFHCQICFLNFLKYHVVRQNCLLGSKLCRVPIYYIRSLYTI